MRNSKTVILVISLSILIIIIFAFNAREQSKLINYEYKDLLGETRSKLISQLGKDYEVTTQGVNNQNIGLKYNDHGLLIGIDEASDKVVEVQILDGEYLGVSTKMNVSEAVDVMKKKEVKILTMMLNGVGTWYICDLGDFRIRLSPESVSINKVQIFITLEDFN